MRLPVEVAVVVAIVGGIERQDILSYETVSHDDHPRVRPKGMGNQTCVLKRHSATIHTVYPTANLTGRQMDILPFRSHMSVQMSLQCRMSPMAGMRFPMSTTTAARSTQCSAKAPALDTLLTDIFMAYIVMAQRRHRP